MNVPASDGKILYELIIKNNYKKALEIGTSTGHSAIWIAWALSKTGGKLITVEINEERYQEAIENFKETGLSDYREIWDLQKILFNRVTDSRDQNYLLLTEHRPVITIGKSGTKAHLVADSQSLQNKDIEVIKVDRGGDITFHGPGQLVGYPIFNLHNFKMDIHWYLRSLEQIIIDTLLKFNIKSTRVKNLTGVWIGGKKICAIGVKITRWITMHGFALNVTTDLNYFQHIIPCGIREGGVTSISEILGNNIALKDVSRYLISNFEKYFELKIVSQDISTLT